MYHFFWTPETDLAFSQLGVPNMLQRLFKNGQPCLLLSLFLSSAYINALLNTSLDGFPILAHDLGYNLNHEEALVNKNTTTSIWPQGNNNQNYNEGRSLQVKKV